jgi:hypothetical protein
VALFRETPKGRRGFPIIGDCAPARLDGMVSFRQIRSGLGPGYSGVAAQLVQRGRFGSPET